MTRTPLSRSKGQGHQAALLTAAFTHQAAAAVSVGKYSPWEPTATLPSAGAAIGSAARGASAPTEGGEERGHIGSAGRLLLVLNKLCGRPPEYAPATCKLTFDLVNLKVVSESRVTWATSVPILVFLGLSVLDLGPMYATDRRQTDRRASSLNAPTLGGGGIIIMW